MGMAKGSALRVFDYTDYRKYLSDYYDEQKKKTPSFSYRFFAKKAGYNSSGLYKDILSNRTGMYRDLIARVARGASASIKKRRPISRAWSISARPGTSRPGSAISKT
jgi:uncharacterized protein (TIGR02147 family)